MSFKKHISLLLALVLLVCNVGFAFDVHYCGGEVASVKPVYLHSDQKPGADSCCGEKVKKEKHCCKNKTIHFQKKSDDTIIKAFSFSAVAVFFDQAWKPNLFTSISDFAGNPETAYHCEANAPPLYKLYRQLIFYA